MENMDYLEMLMKIANAQTNLFPKGDEPFKIGCRVLEEAGELVSELNHYERRGISIEKGNSDGKEHMALEAFQVCEVVCQLMQYFNLSDTFKECIKSNYIDYIEKGYIK
jgi:NTP pyrophosphatase (non-canonical NTP hydrolase)